MLFRQVPRVGVCGTLCYVVYSVSYSRSRHNPMRPISIQSAHIKRHIKGACYWNSSEVVPPDLICKWKEEWSARVWPPIHRVERGEPKAVEIGLYSIKTITRVLGLQSSLPTYRYHLLRRGQDGGLLTNLNELGLVPPVWTFPMWCI